MVTRRMRRSLLAPALFLASICLVTAGAEVGGKAPDFTLKDVRTGKSVKLSSLRGKPVVMDIFTTW